MGRERTRYLRATTAAAVFVLALAGCGGGGGGGSPPTPTTPPPTVTFTATAAPGSGSVSLQPGAGSGGSVLVLEVTATELTAAYGIAFDLVYPASVVTYRSFSEGSFLGGGSGGSSTSVQVAESSSGTLVVGATRLGDIGSVTGSGIVLTLTFDVAAAGNGSISFSSNQLYDEKGNIQPGINWLGGTVAATG